MPAGLADDIWAWIEQFPKCIDDLEELLTENRIFKQRTVDIGIVDRGPGARLGLLRPVPARLRRRLGPAQGAALRRLRPDRFRHARRQERRLLRPLPGAHVRDAGEPEDHPAVPARRCRRARCRIDDRKIAPPPRAEMKRSMEALIHHFKLYTEGYHVPAGETYTVVEAPKGEFGVYLVADGTNRPYRCKIRAPGFAHLQAMDFLCRGPHAGRCRRDHRLARHRLRGDRPMSAHNDDRWRSGPPFAFTAENLEEAQRHHRQVSGGRQASAVMPLLDLAQRQNGGWLPRRRSTTSPGSWRCRRSASTRSRPSTRCST